jgi:tRNA dimethylallyltransferase
MSRAITPLIITGPTGSGKTAVAAELARRIGGEIISADSRQVYRFLDIGTNKAGKWDDGRKARLYRGIPQHLTDCIDPSESYNAGEFVRAATALIARMKRSGIVPIITGGTGLYLQSLIDGLSPLPERDPALRQALQERIERQGIESLYNDLKEKDPVAAEKHRKNPQRLLRALEVFLLTGMPITELHKQTKPPEETFLQFGLDRTREELYHALDTRSEEMLSEGMVDETRKVLAMGFLPSAPGLQSLGYREIVAHLEGALPWDEVRESLKRNTRHYAKRQLTWFRRDTRIRWIPAKEKEFVPAMIAGAIAKIIGM